MNPIIAIKLSVVLLPQLTPSTSGIIGVAGPRQCVLASVFAAATLRRGLREVMTIEVLGVAGLFHYMVPI